MSRFFGTKYKFFFVQFFFLQNQKDHKKDHKNVKMCCFLSPTREWAKQIRNKNLEIGVSTKLIVTARIRGNVLPKMTFFKCKKFGKKI